MTTLEASDNSGPKIVNGNDVEELRAFQIAVANDRSEASRQPSLVAHWEGGSRSRIEYGDIVTHIGGDQELNAMQTILASLAACDVDLIALHASLLGIRIESLSVEAQGHFNVASYLGVEDSTGSGYDHISYVIRLRAPQASDEQLAYLSRICEEGSPVGDTLSRNVPMEFRIENDG